MTALKSNPVLPDQPALAATRQSEGADPGTGLYLHVPFCLKKCPYCSFYSISGRADLHSRYIRAVTKQMRRFADCRNTRELSTTTPLTSIFFGGGTPTLLPPVALSRLLADCLTHFCCADAPEISIEVNPATVDYAALCILREGGFNRLSIGAQSFNELELQRLGRPHSAENAVQTVRLARQAGFANINLDLMYGLPGQKVQTWCDTLEQALALEPQHLSIYELTIEPGTPFASQQEQGYLSLPAEDSVLLMLDITRQMLNSAGFDRYEISNYAKPRFRCRHNINYWRNGSYIGLGPGAAACLDSTRYTAVADVDHFCGLMENGEEVWREKETLDPEAAFRETIIMGLRMTVGVSLHDVQHRFGIDAATYYGDTLDRLIRQEMLEIIQGHLRLTAQGLLLADTVMTELV
jgi:oxygen-independent coproporphyrinogen-3 oxidase